jgi:transposase InsO family protein
MPWNEVSPMQQRVQFISDYLRDVFSITELCERYGVSRKTGYKWIERYLQQGPGGLERRSSRPHYSPKSLSGELVEAIVQLRLRHPSWGASKLMSIIARRHPRWTLPARSTVNEILSRHGLVNTRPKRRAVGHPGKPSALSLAPNEVWCVDFKGEFKTGDGQYCYPLTVTDNYSRMLLACQSLPSTKGELVMPVFKRLFQEYGLPQRIRSDNGAPFATTALGRLSALSVWWIRLGVLPDLIEPGKPQQNGRHERMHRTLKAETTRPAAATLSAQQRRFNLWRREFNELRPHEALDFATPASMHRASTRAYPATIAPFEYPDRLECRLVSENGGIKWNKRWVNVSQLCAGEYVGFEEIDDGVWQVYFRAVKIGRFHERLMRIEDQYGKLARR